MLAPGLSVWKRQKSRLMRAFQEWSMWYVYLVIQISFKAFRIGDDRY